MNVDEKRWMSKDNAVDELEYVCLKTLESEVDAYVWVGELSKLKWMKDI